MDPGYPRIVELIAQILEKEPSKAYGRHNFWNFFFFWYQIFGSPADRPKFRKKQIIINHVATTRAHVSTANARGIQTRCPPSSALTPYNITISQQSGEISEGKTRTEIPRMASMSIITKNAFLNMPKKAFPPIPYLSARPKVSRVCFTTASRSHEVLTKLNPLFCFYLQNSKILFFC